MSSPIWPNAQSHPIVDESLPQLSSHGVKSFLGEVGYGCWLLASSPVHALPHFLDGFVANGGEEMHKNGIKERGTLLEDSQNYSLVWNFVLHATPKFWLFLIRGTSMRFFFFQETTLLMAAPKPPAWPLASNSSSFRCTALISPSHALGGVFLSSIYKILDDFMHRYYASTSALTDCESTFHLQTDALARLTPFEYWFMSQVPITVSPNSREYLSSSLLGSWKCAPWLKWE